MGQLLWRSTAQSNNCRTGPHPWQYCFRTTLWQRWCGSKNSCVRRLSRPGSAWHTTTQNYWIVEIRHDLWRSPSPTRCPEQGQGEQAAQLEPRWVLEAYSESELSRAFPNAQSPSIPIICSKNDPGTMWSCLLLPLLPMISVLKPIQSINHELWCKFIAQSS